MTIDQLLNGLYLMNTEHANTTHDVLVGALGNGNINVISDHVIWYTRLLYDNLPPGDRRNEIEEILQMLEETDWNTI